jgi:hypothetical protein
LCTRDPDFVPLAMALGIPLDYEHVNLLLHTPKRQLDCRLITAGECQTGVVWVLRVAPSIWMLLWALHPFLRGM